MAADVTTESLAAELLEMIHERWLASAHAGYVFDCAGLEAQIALIGALRTCATDPQAGAAVMRAAKQALREMAVFAGQGDFAARLTQILGSSAARARRSRAEG